MSPGRSLVALVLAGAMSSSVPARAARAEAEQAEQAEPAPSDSAGDTSEEGAAPGGDGDASEDPEEQARIAYERGQELYAKGEYETALGAFLDAQRLYASPVHHYNIARCYEALGNYSMAIDYYRAYLRGNPSDSPNIENRIDRLMEIVEAQKSKAEPSDEPEPKTEPEPVTPPTGTEPPAVDEPSSRRPGTALVATGSVLIVTGAALAAVGGAVLGLRAADRDQAVDDVLEGGNPQGLTVDETRTLDEEGRNAGLGQGISIGVGAGLAVAGAALLGWGLVKRRRGPQRAGLVPTWSRRGVGVTLQGRF